MMSQMSIIMADQRKVKVRDLEDWRLEGNHTVRAAIAGPHLLLPLMRKEKKSAHKVTYSRRQHNFHQSQKLQAETELKGNTDV